VVHGLRRTGNGPAQVLMRALWLGKVLYEPVWALQKELRGRVLDGGEETLLLLEHEPVVTLGHRATAADLLVSVETLAAQGISVARIERGGQATFHGPGQLVVYPICRLRGGVVGHVDWLAHAAVSVSVDLGVAATCKKDPVGIWVAQKKLGAIGVHVEHQVAIHGLSFNVTRAATQPFRRGLFAACGVKKPEVTSLVEEGADSSVTTREVAFRFAKRLLDARGERNVVVEEAEPSAFFGEMSSAVTR